MYKIGEERLKELIIAEQRLNALECGGVDNWTWYGDSMVGYLKNEGADSFKNLAERILKEHYEVI